MNFVLDASVALAWMLRESKTGLVARARAATSTETVHVPANWHLEMVNGLIMATRATRLTPDELVDALQAVAEFPVQVDVGGAVATCGPVAVLAQHHGLTAYDAAYLELALRLDAPLATQDGKLARAAEAAGGKVF